MKNHWKKTAFGFGIVGILVGGLAQPANAYSSTYFQGQSEALAQHNSPVYSNVRGGAITSGIYTAELYLTTTTWSGYGGGYTVYGKGSGTSPGPVRHYNYPSASYAQNGCFWHLPGGSPEGYVHLKCESTL